MRGRGPPARCPAAWVGSRVHVCRVAPPVSSPRCSESRDAAANVARPGGPLWPVPRAVRSFVYYSLRARATPPRHFFTTHYYYFLLTVYIRGAD